MNIAVAAIAVFFLLLPGVLFTHFFRLTDGEKTYTTFSKITIMAVISSAVLHLAMVALLESLDQSVNYAALFDFIDGKTLTKETVQTFENYRWVIASYFFTLYTVAIILGKAANYFIIKHCFDIRYPFFVLGSHWYTAFRARVKEASPYLKHNPESVLVVMDALIIVGGRSWIYTGVVDRFVEKACGELDTVVLTQAIRRDFGRLSTEASERYEIPSTYLYLKFSDILNFNLIYSYLDENENWVLINS